MRQPLGCMSDGCQIPQGRLLLADSLGRLREVCEEMYKVSGVRSPAPPKAGSAT